MSVRSRSALAFLTIGLVAIVMVLAPGVSSACAVCMSGDQEDTRLAFIFMTAFMTFTPLIVLFFAIRWFLRLSREHDRAQDIVRANGAAEAHRLRTTAARS